MLYPSIDDLMEKVPSKYLLVTITAKRAREMLDSQNLLMGEKDYQCVKFVGKSLEEIAHGLIVVDDESAVNA